MIAVELMTPFLNEVPIPNYTRQYKTTVLQKNFTNKFNELLNSGENLSSQQLQTFLNQWNSTTEESIGSQISDILISNLSDKLNQYITSAGFRDRFFEGLDSDIDRKEFTTKTRQFFINEITAYIENYMSLMKSANIQQNKALLASMKAGKTILNLKLPAGTQGWSVADIEKMKNSDSALMQRLGNIIEGLADLTGKTPILSSKGEVITSPGHLLNSLRGLFDKLGGEEILEPVAVALGQSASSVVPKEMIERLTPLATDGKLSIKWDERLTAKKGQGEKSGKEIVPDYTIQYQFNSGSGIITIELPVSMKIRQSRQFLQGNSILGKGFTTFGSMNFEKALKIVANNVTISNLEKGWGAVYYKGSDGDLEPTKSEDYNSFENPWRNILQDVKIYIAQRTLVGTMRTYEMSNGQIKPDMVAIVHINNKFISVYDILTHLNDENFLKWANSDGSHVYSDRKFREYVPLRKTQEEGWISKENRINYVKKNIQELYDRTVAIYLNIGSLM